MYCGGRCLTTASGYKAFTAKYDPSVGCNVKMNGRVLTLTVSRHLARQLNFCALPCSTDDVTSGTASRPDDRRRGHLLTSPSVAVRGKPEESGGGTAERETRVRQHLDGPIVLICLQVSGIEFSLFSKGKSPQACLCWRKKRAIPLCLSQPLTGQSKIGVVKTRARIYPNHCIFSADCHERLEVCCVITTNLYLRSSDLSRSDEASLKARGVNEGALPQSYQTRDA